MEMKVECEKCRASLAVDSPAFVCSYECTFCPGCFGDLAGVCPNCGGELVARPRRGGAGVAVPLSSLAGIVFQSEPALKAEEFIDVLKRSTLGERRPVEDPAVMAGMVLRASVLITARDAGRLVGVSRALTDFSYCTYLSDLAVDVAYQRKGIGKRLIEETHAAAGIDTTLILLAAPKARTYYPHIGMRNHDSCWIREALPVLP